MSRAVLAALRSASRLRWRALTAVAAAAVVLVLPGAGSGNGETLLAVTRDGAMYVVRPDGSGLTDVGAGFAPAWSPDGTRLAFVDGGDVWILHRSSGARSRITATAATESPPAWSPDGTRLAFVSVPQGTDPAELDVAKADGSGVRRLMADASRSFQAPNWSPDGLEIAYMVARGQTTDIAVTRADGSSVRRLTDDEVVDFAPLWSPDGRVLAFVRTVLGTVDHSLYVIGTAGEGLRRVSATPAGVVSVGIWGSWSPDGRHIAFSDQQVIGYAPRGGYPLYSWTIHVVDVADGAERTLKAGFHPVWSPDGARIAYDGGGVYVMNAAGTCRTLVLPGALGATPWQGPSAPPAPPLRCADLSLSAVQDRSEAARSGEVRVELTAKNLETETATGVRLEVDAPSGGSLTSLTADRGSCSESACELGTLPVGAVAKATAVVKADDLGRVASRARVRATEPDGYPDNEIQIAFDAVPCTLVGTWAGDRLVGTPGPDVICARQGQDLIFGLAGADRIDAGNGDDYVVPGRGADRIDLQGGKDVIDARDGRRDLITCGGEADIALVDRLDQASDRCEVVSRTKLLCRSANTWRIRGSFRADVIVGTAERRRRDSLCGFSGNDTLIGLDGDDALDGGSGNDTLEPGPGRDLVLGGAGYDTIEARDGARDRIRCGSEDDVVIADRVDRVAADCEHVNRH